MSSLRPIKLYHFLPILNWWHSPFKCGLNLNVRVIANLHTVLLCVYGDVWRCGHINHGKEKKHFLFQQIVIFIFSLQICGFVICSHVLRSAHSWKPGRVGGRAGRGKGRGRGGGVLVLILCSLVQEKFYWACTVSPRNIKRFDKKRQIWRLHRWMKVWSMARKNRWRLS
jgi:hypothetical protein